MSKFSSRAKFLSILAAATAVGKTGAGATTIPDHKYIPASSEAQKAARLELNANRNNLYVTKGPRFSIDPNSVAIGAVSATALGAAGLLIKNLFFNESRDAVNFVIENLKKSKCNGIAFVVTPFGTLPVTERLLPVLKSSFESYGSNAEKLAVAAEKSAADAKKSAADLRKLVLGFVEICRSLPLGPVVTEPALVSVYAGKDGKIHCAIHDGDFTEETLEQAFKKEAPEAQKDKRKVAMFKVIKDIFNSRLVKEVLVDAINKKNYYVTEQPMSEANEIAKDFLGKAKNFSKGGQGMFGQGIFGQGMFDQGMFGQGKFDQGIGNIESDQILDEVNEDEGEQ
ncbi:MAG: hypothetical protein J6P21_03500 [Clostridia bacterium]|nr:hypothetical protein [Clostridia bacterium]